MNQLRRVAIIGGNRIPFARSNGPYATASNQDMLTAAFKGVVDKFGFRGARLGDAGAGAVIKHARDWDMVREGVMGSGLSFETPGFDLQRACGTSLETAIIPFDRFARNRARQPAPVMATESRNPYAAFRNRGLFLVGLTVLSPGILLGLLGIFVLWLIVFGLMGAAIVASDLLRGTAWLIRVLLAALGPRAAGYPARP